MSRSMTTLIEDWLIRFAGDGALRRDDIHIDRIDTKYQRRTSWIDGGLACLEAAASATRDTSPPITVAIELFLKNAQQKNAPLEASLRELRMSATPPALVAYHAGAAPWSSDSSFARLVDSFALPNSFQAEFYIQEWFDEEDQEFDRRLWIVAV